VFKMIIVSGELGGYMVGGQTWAFLNYLIGMKRLGHDIFFYEETRGTPSIHDKRISPAQSVKYVSSLMKKFKLGNYAMNFRGKLLGADEKELNDAIRNADLLINMNGRLKSEDIKNKIKKTVYLDIDPGFTQLWCCGVNNKEYSAFARNKIKEYKANLQNHDLHFTIGQNIGNNGCMIPTLGIKWKKTLHPALLDIWTPNPKKHDRFTTVSHWDGGMGAYYKGEFYGYKFMEFLKYIDLPRRVDQQFEVATYRMKERILNRFKRNKWIITNSRKCSKNIETYKKHIEDSKGEFSVVRNGCIKSNCGWIGERNIAYLCAGKPVILQDTGFSEFLPTGKGLFAFTNMQEAVDAVNDVNKDYEYHCKEARKVAEKYFDSDKVLGKMLKQCGV